MPSLLGAVGEALARSGVDLAGLALAWARALPTVTIVPAFGLRALPAAARGIVGLVLAVAIFPDLVPLAATGGPWTTLLLQEVLRGLPVALAAAVPLWAATMAGGVADALRGAQTTTSVPVVEAGATPLGVPFSLLASSLFLTAGGPSRVALALVRPDEAHALGAALSDLTSGITIAVALSGPLLVASIVVEVAGALVARAASPAQIHLVLAPLRSISLLVIVGLSLGRMSVVLAQAVQHAPGHVASP